MASDDENTEPVEHWKDPRCLVPTDTGFKCGACNKVSKMPTASQCYPQRLPPGNKRKAINHWAQVHNDPSATITRCACPHKVPGLAAFAKKETAAHRKGKADKDLAIKMQKQLDEARRREEMERISSSLPTGSVTTSKLSKDQPTLTSQSWQVAHKQELDLAIERHIVEDATPLSLPQKPAFKEMIANAIEYGAQWKLH